MTRFARTRRFARWLHAVGGVRLVDAFIVLVSLIFYAVAWPTLHLTHQVPPIVQPIVAAMAAGPFLLIRINPALGWALSALSALVIGTLVPTVPPWDYPWQVVQFIVLPLLLAAVSVRAPLPVVGVALASTVALYLTLMPGSDGTGWSIGAVGWVAVGLLLRWLVVSRRKLAEQEEVSELERARRTILEEKARIARDLHDVVAHHMSMVVVAAQTAPYRLNDVSPEAATEFAAIGATARDALNEIRGMLGVLRSDGALAADEPAPGASDIVSLVDASRRSGLDVQLAVTGDAARLSDTVGLVLYRVAQESVSNAARHAPGSAIDLRLDYDDRWATLTLSNGPSSSPSAAVESGRAGGHGIAGMRERVTAVGGSLVAAPTVGGGFAVVAHVPVSSAILFESAARRPELHVDA